MGNQMRYWAAVGICLAVSIAGCDQKRGGLGANRKSEAGPPRAMAVREVIDLAQRNTRDLAKFRSKGGRLSVKFPTDKGMKQYDLDGVAVIYESPRNLFLSGSAFGQVALKIGSNEDRYWLGVERNPTQFFWGYWKFADSECNTWRMGGPVRLLEALGQVNLRSHDSRFIGPAIEQTGDANVLTYMSLDDVGYGYFSKRIFLTRTEPLTIDRIVYYKPDGAEELVISYSDYRDVGGQGLMAYRVELTWPDESSYMKLSLGKVSPVPEVPQEAFNMPDAATYNQVEQVDAKCGQSAKEDTDEVVGKSISNVSPDEKEE